MQICIMWLGFAGTDAAAEQVGSLAVFLVPASAEAWLASARLSAAGGKRCSRPMARAIHAMGLACGRAAIRRSTVVPCGHAGVAAACSRTICAVCTAALHRVLSEGHSAQFAMLSLFHLLVSPARTSS